MLAPSPGRSRATGAAPPSACELAHDAMGDRSRNSEVTMNDAASVDRIRKYLGGLTPQARASLLVEIERMLLYGEAVPGANVMLAELRAEFRKAGLSSDRAGNPSRYFFKPIEA